MKKYLILIVTPFLCTFHTQAQETYVKVDFDTFPVVSEEGQLPGKWSANQAFVSGGAVITEGGTVRDSIDGSMAIFMKADATQVGGKPDNPKIMFWGARIQSPWISCELASVPDPMQLVFSFDAKALGGSEFHEVRILFRSKEGENPVIGTAHTSFAGMSPEWQNFSKPLSVFEFKDGPPDFYDVGFIELFFTIGQKTFGLDSDNELYLDNIQLTLPAP